MGPVAVLAGTDRAPEVHCLFQREATHQRNGTPLIEWIKKSPRRHWDQVCGHWVITAFGGVGFEPVPGSPAGPVIPHDAKPRSPERLLRAAGFRIAYDPTEVGGPAPDPSLDDALSLDDFVEPLCRQSKVKPVLALVRPRFAGWEMTRALLGVSARWDKETGRFEVPLTDLLAHGDPKRHLQIDKATIEAAREALTANPIIDEAALEDTALLGRSTGVDLSAADDQALSRLIERVGDVPDWFGFELRPYQRIGAIAAAAGRGFIGDEPGLGKTPTALATLSITNTNRALIIVPPVVLTNWVRETVKSGFAIEPPKTTSKTTSKTTAGRAALKGAKAATSRTACDQETALALSGETPGTHIAPPTATGGHNPDGPYRTDAEGEGEENTAQARHVVVFKAGRKEPELPHRGVVVVPESLVALRPELRQSLVAWGPDAVIYDEFHHLRTWTSKRTQAILDMVYRMPRETLRIGLSGTPMAKSPEQLVGLLAFTGHLDPVFGGRAAFLARYCKRNKFNALVPNPLYLDELKRLLVEKVWVRRHKSDVLKDLPPKARYARYVDVDLAGFNAAHEEVIAKVTEWLERYLETDPDETGDYPSDTVVAQYAASQIGLISPLRKAAGLAKVPAAADLIRDWITDEVEFNADGSFSCDRPLLVWAHHKEVIAALLAEGHKLVPANVKGTVVGVIDGATSADRRGEIVDQFQAGRLPVLICSISAASVGITLTRGSDAFFVETSYNVDEVAQAEDRQSRYGQTVPTSNTTLIATGTLDEHIQRILIEDAELLDAVVGGSQSVAVVEKSELSETSRPSKIVRALIDDAIERHRKKNRRSRAA